MKKKWIFVLSVTVEILLAFLSWYLANQYEAAYQALSYAAGAFFFSVIALFNCKNADKPIKDWGAYDSVKAGLQNRGKLHRYKYWAYGALILATIIGVSCFVVGVAKIFM